VDRWLDTRLTQVPPALRRRVEDALRKTEKGASGRAERLRAAADILLAEAANAPPSRETALALLAADALLTYACESVAESSPEALGEMR